MNIAKGLNLELGSDVVLAPNNKDGSVNGITLRVGGLSENILGPTGKDGYLHIDDAKTLLRIEGEELTQVAVKLKSFDRLDAVYEQLEAELIEIKDKSGNPAFEVSAWEQLSPFTSVAQIVDLLIIVVRVILISIALISVLNVMMMSVYERVSEVGTIASIGTPPGRILSLFLVEGFSSGFISSIVGSILGIAILFVIKVVKINFTFGRMDISLSPAIPFTEVLLTILIVVIISIISTFTIYNLNDNSFLLAVSLSYKPFTNFEVMLWPTFLMGDEGTEFGGRQFDQRYELRMRVVTIHVIHI